ncbi:MAG: hypothetical protein HY704_09030 [Gemmatimonadetes bacterium]|nr:hypothetical protein [Gemmatimonadota bacterium]
MRVQRRLLAALGGQDAWERTRYMEFDWIVARPDRSATRRSHRWDRWTGDYRVETPMGQDRMIAVFNVKVPANGRVWMNGVRQDGPGADSLLQRAYSIFINDSYWFLMPYKWLDPGVNLAYLGRKTEEEGRNWEVVELTFNNVGLTPQNVYHAYVNAETGLMERWYHFPRRGADPLITDWTDWRRCGPILVAADRPYRSAQGHIHFENLRCETSVPEGAFAAPEG